MLIGLVGQKGVGKDETGNYLVEYYNFTKTHFADPLKESIRHIFNLNDEQLYGKDKETLDLRWNKTPRELFQIFGTDIMRNIMSPMLGLGNNIWVYRFKVWYEGHKEENIVVADVRFKSEAEEIKKLGGILIRIDRNTKKTDYHISEQEVNDIIVDYTLSNIGTKNDLFFKIKLLMEKLTKEEMQQN